MTIPSFPLVTIVTTVTTALAVPAVAPSAWSPFVRGSSLSQPMRTASWCPSHSFFTVATAETLSPREVPPTFPSDSRPRRGRLADVAPCPAA
jgi:hypothetical protein